jgi:hypothetical protein
MFVRSPNGKTTTVEAKASDTVGILKARIQAETGIYPALQRLIFAGKQLRNDCTLAYYNIMKESIVGLVFDLVGGAPEQAHQVGIL